MAKRIVIALGGNALGKNLEEQMQAVKTTASAIADLIEDGHEVVIAHGNGPQVGMIQNAFAAYHKQQAKSDIMPLSMCVAMSQGYIGYDLQNMIGEELDRRGLGIHCATVLTQVAVDPADPAFQHPTKPIGAFMTEEEAKKLAAEKGIDVAEDAGRGWRQVVASPRPKEIVEIATVKALMNAKHAVIAAGGGGPPVVWEEKSPLKGVPAVIDKDFASECMAEQLDADMLRASAAEETRDLRGLRQSAERSCFVIAWEEIIRIFHQIADSLQADVECVIFCVHDRNAAGVLCCLKQADACAPVKGGQGKQAADRHKPGLPDAGVVNIAVSEVSQAAFEGQKAALRIFLDEYDAGAGSGVRIGENKPVVYAALLQRCAHHAPAVIVRHAG